MKFAADRPYADPEKAARKLLEIANAAEAVQDGRIHIELINAPFSVPETPPIKAPSAVPPIIAKRLVLGDECGFS